MKAFLRDIAWHHGIYRIDPFRAGNSPQEHKRESGIVSRQQKTASRFTASSSHHHAVFTALNSPTDIINTSLIITIHLIHKCSSQHNCHKHQNSKNIKRSSTFLGDGSHSSRRYLYRFIYIRGYIKRIR